MPNIKAGETYQTRGGRPVRVIAIAPELGDFCVVAIIGPRPNSDDESSGLESYTLAGKYLRTEKSEWDLILFPVPPASE